MPLPRLSAIVLALAAVVVAGSAAGAASLVAQPAVKTPTSLPDPTMARPIVFYLAHGEADTCGPGCSEWIAAEGKIDAGAIGRLQHLLARLSKPLPPLFLHSPGGHVTGSIELGRLIRARRLTVSVGHTVPLVCDRDPLGAKMCELQISTGQTIEARIDPLTAVCASACVYVLAGGSTRLIPPWATLGIHDVGFVPTAGRPAPTRLAIMIGKELADEHLRAYMRDMGIDQRLLTEAFSIPFTSVALLSREEAVRFGLDRREFAETAWQFSEKPEPAMRKTFFVRTDDSKARYINGVVSVFCARGNDNHSGLSILREHVSADAADIAQEPPANVTLNGQTITIARAPYNKFYVRQGPVPQAAMDSMVDTATLVVPGTELGRQQSPSGDVTLTMLGFTQAHAKLQEACLNRTTTTAVAVRTSGTGPSSLTMPVPFQSLLSGPLEAGATRAKVDAALGAPTKMVGNVSLYGYTSSSNERKVMAGYFKGDSLNHFARFVLKNGKVFDEISNSELSEGLELSAVRSLLASPVAAGRPATPAPTATLSH